jgi:hypothetical protein
VDYLKAPKRHEETSGCTFELSQTIRTFGTLAQQYQHSLTPSFSVILFFGLDTWPFPRVRRAFYHCYAVNRIQLLGFHNAPYNKHFAPYITTVFLPPLNSSQVLIPATMAQYGYGQSPQYGAGPGSAQNLQFYSSSFSNQPVSGHSTPFQAGYGVPQTQAYPSQYGAGFSAPGVSGQMGVGSSGLRTGWLAAFGTEGYVK